MAEGTFTVSPPGLSGMVKLGNFLDALKESGAIGEWHPGRWENRSRRHTVIRFDSEDEAAGALQRWSR